MKITPRQLRLIAICGMFVSLILQTTLGFILWSISGVVYLIAVLLGRRQRKMNEVKYV